MTDLTANLNSSHGETAMHRQLSHDEGEAASLLLQVEQLYERGRYLEAFEISKPLGAMSNWRGAHGRVMAGRLSGNLGAPRLGRALHWLAAREYPADPASQYYGAMTYWNRFGPLHAWRRFHDQHLAENASDSLKADWLALKAAMLASMRDFARAEPLMIEALELDPESPWLHVQMSELLDRQDLHEDALLAAREALDFQPFYRPAVQTAAHRLVQLRQDDDALQLLTAATTQLQSGEVWCQLAALQRELKDYVGAWASLEQAQQLWPLADADSHYQKWLMSERCDLACLLQRYEEAIELAKQIDRPFYQHLVERLTQAISDRARAVHPSRVQLPVPFVRQFHDACVPATLTAIANYWQKPVHQQEIAERICYDGTRCVDERRWSEENDFHVREFRVTEENVERLINVGVPMTLTTVDPGYAHSQGIVGFDTYRGTFLIQDPSQRHVGEASTEKFLKHYASTGPRGMALVPSDQSARIAELQLADAELYDEHYKVDQALANFQREQALVAIERMRSLDKDHRLTLQCELALARYDADPTRQIELVEKLLLQFPGDANLLLMKLGQLQEFGQRSQRIELLRAACDGSETYPILWARLAGELLDDARDQPEAFHQLRRALRFNPSDAQSLSLLANYYWARSQREQAFELYRLAASVNEKDEDHAQRYFMAARYLHQTEAALAWLRDRCRRFNNRSSSPGRTLASALEMIDHVQESQAVLEETVQRHPRDGELLTYAALYFGRYQQLDRAASYLADCEGKCSPLVIKRTRATLAIFEGKPHEARDLFREVVQLAPLDMGAHQRFVQLELDLAGIEAAEFHLRNAITRFPHSYSLRTALIQFLRIHKVAAVQAELDLFIELHPRDAWARREAAIAAMSCHDLERASKESQAALELEPISDCGHGILGRIYEMRGELESARMAYRRAIELNVDNELAIHNLLGTCDRPTERQAELAFILQQLRQQTTHGEGITAYRDAAQRRMEPVTLLAHLQEARAHRPDLWQAWSVVIHQHMDMNQKDEAIKLAREATERFPMIPRIWLDLAMAYHRAQDEASELAALERAQAINPHWVDVAQALAELYMNRDQAAEAESVLRRVLTMDPRDSNSLAALADCLYRSDKKREALETLAGACVHAPGFELGWSRLYDWSDELDQGMTARTIAEKASDANPHDARCYLRKAESLRELEHIPKALETLEQALKLDARYVDAHVLKAFYLGRLHRWDEALDACNPPCFAGETPVVMSIRRAFLLYRKGLVSAATAEMHAALQRDPDHYGAWMQLADWAQEQNRRDLYLQAAENMVRLEPHQAIPRGYLADALMDSDQGRESAKAHLHKALEYSPDYAFGTMRLFDLHFDDNELAQARHVLQLGGAHLPDGYQSAFNIQLQAVEDLANQPIGTAASKQILLWLEQEIPDYDPLERTLDQLDPRLGLPLIKQLNEVISSETARKCEIKPAVGWSLGRLCARLLDQRGLIDQLKSIPNDAYWHECVRSYLSSMRKFGKEYPLLQAIIAKFRSRLKKQTPTFSATASTLFDFGLMSEVVKWTRDWRSYPDLVTKDLIPVVSARWELYQFREARKAIVQGLSLPEDEHTSWLRVLAGLDALLTRQVDAALEHARNVNVSSLQGLYQIGYRMLVTTLESMPGAASEHVRSTQHLIARLDPKEFLADTPFINDKLTKWLSRQMAARIAEAYGHRFTAWKHRLVAFSYTLT